MNDKPATIKRERQTGTLIKLDAEGRVTDSYPLSFLGRDGKWLCHPAARNPAHRQGRSSGGWRQAVAAPGESGLAKSARAKSARGCLPAEKHVSVPAFSLRPASLRAPHRRSPSSGAVRPESPPEPSSVRC